MAKHDDSKHFLTFSLIAVCFVAVLCIVAMVLLVSNGPALPQNMAYGNQIVVADAEENMVGDVKTVSRCPPRSTYVKGRCIPWE